MLLQLGVIVLLVHFAYGNCLHGTSSNPRRITANGTVEISKFGYTGSTGPLLWQTLGTDNSLCEKGDHQSPINIDDTVLRAPKNPSIKVDSVNFLDFENLGSTVEVIANGSAKFQSGDFALRQFHFHSPSEHRIEEEYFPLEMHMVHEASDKRLLVMAVLFDLSSTKTTTLISTLANIVSRISTPGAITQSGPLDLTPMARFLEATTLRQYSGSLTTPPCKEGVTFLVAEKALPIDVQSFNALKKVLKFNSRFTQGPLGEVNLIERALKSVRVV